MTKIFVSLFLIKFCFIRWNIYELYLWICVINGLIWIQDFWLFFNRFYDFIFDHLVQAEITGSPRLSPFVGSQQQPLHFFKMKRDQLLCDLSTQNYERAPSESLILKVLSIKRKWYNDSRAERNSLINLTFKTIVSSLINFHEFIKIIKRNLCGLRVWNNGSREIQ